MWGLCHGRIRVNMEACVGCLDLMPRSDVRGCVADTVDAGMGIDVVGGAAFFCEVGSMCLEALWMLVGGRGSR